MGRQILASLSLIALFNTYMAFLRLCNIQSAGTNRGPIQSIFQTRKILSAVVIGVHFKQVNKARSKRLICCLKVLERLKFPSKRTRAYFYFAIARTTSIMI